MSKFLIDKFYNLEAYVPGEQPKDQKYIKLNTNEAPYQASPNVVKAIDKSVVAGLNLYCDPDTTELTQTIADFYGVDFNEVFIGNGSDEVLSLIMMAFIDEKSKVIRCMPTLTAQEGMGSFAVCKSEDVTDKEFKDVEKFLSSCGIVEKIPEDLMDEVVPLNGSAPGYFYHMANVVANEGEKMGFDKEVALRLFAQTMKGSAETILNSGMSIETLESKLRLKGGTTIAALDKMDELGFERCIIEGVRACVARSKELGKL